jgi:hypothetical protein
MNVEDTLIHDRSDPVKTLIRKNTYNMDRFTREYSYNSDDLMYANG